MPKTRDMECPVGPCEGKKAYDEAMCPSCWFSVPKPLRDEVWRTFRRYGAWGDPAIEAREEAIQFAETERFGPPTATCPKCGDEVHDLDGFGVLFHSECGYCTHASVTGDRCDACGWRVSSDGIWFDPDEPGDGRDARGGLLP